MSDLIGTCLQVCFGLQWSYAEIIMATLTLGLIHAILATHNYGS